MSKIEIGSGTSATPGGTGVTSVSKKPHEIPRLSSGLRRRPSFILSAGVQVTAHRLIRIACVLACLAGATTGAACDQSPATPSPPATLSNSPTVSSGPWEVSGVAVGDDGRPIANAPVWVNVGRPNVPVMTDETGRYTTRVEARLGGYVYRSTAMLYLDAGKDYEHEHRLFRPTGADPHQILDLHPRLIRWISVGESVSVTVAPDDAPCFNNVQDGSWHLYYVCRTFRLIVPADGVLTAEVFPVDANSPGTLLEMEGPGDLDCCYQGNPLTMSVAAGMVVKISVEVVEGSPRQTVTLTTKIR